MSGETIQNGEQRLDQYSIRHLLVALTVGAVVFALLAPGIHLLGEKQQRSAMLQVVVVLGIFSLVVAYQMRRWRKMVAHAGPLIQRFERRSSRYWFWFNTCCLLALNLVHCWLQFRVAQERDEYVVFAFHPYGLVILASYILIRGLWKINPKTIEVRERALVRDFRVVPWEGINRYSWSGSPPNQLNLYLESKYINQLRIEPEQVESLNHLLGERIDTAST